MKILIVDDDLFNRRLMTDFLSPYGTCDVAVNGADALEAYEQALTYGTPYQLITLDIVMPGVDGQQALRQIREMEARLKISSLQAVKVIMVTSECDLKNIAASFNSRCEAYLVKPIEQEQLIGQMKLMGLIA